MTDDNPCLSPIALRFLQDLKLKGLSDRTQESYSRALRLFSEFLGREPDSASEDDLRNYLLHIKNDKQWSASTINVAQQGLKRFFSITCPQTWPTLKLLRVKQELKLPVVLAIGEVHTILKLIEKPAIHCFYTVVYSLGMRLQEALHLQVTDIDSKRMLVHIHRGKGARDRIVPLPMSTLLELRKYYATHRNKLWIFPSEGKTHLETHAATKPMSDSSVQKVIKAVLRQLNWDNRGISTHTFRHCYATHLLESGISLKLIQKYLGHAHLTSTMLYLHVTTVGEKDSIAKINALMKRKS